MLEELASYCGNHADGTPESVLDVELYQLKIKIDIEGHDIWRRVLVPSTYSFRHLHNIIQTVFDWQNYHLHQFEVKREEAKPSLIVLGREPKRKNPELRRHKRAAQTLPVRLFFQSPILIH